MPSLPIRETKEATMASAHAQQSAAASIDVVIKQEEPTAPATSPSIESHEAPATISTTASMDVLIKHEEPIAPTHSPSSEASEAPATISTDASFDVVSKQEEPTAPTEAKEAPSTISTAASIEVVIKQEEPTALTESPSTEASEAPAEISTAESLGLIPTNLPTDADEIRTFRFNPDNNKPAYDNIGRLCVFLQTPKRDLNQQQRQIVFNVISAFSKIEGLDPEKEDRLKVKWLLKTIMGDSPNARRPYQFPEPFPNDAYIVLQTIEEKLSYEDTIEATPTFSPPEYSATPGVKRKRSSEDIPRSVDRPVREMNDRGAQALMRNIRIGKERRTYKINDPSLIISSKKFGDNGLRVGHWWPFRICALRDGAHGAMQAGIAGGIMTGAFSIVVSGAYEGLDRDHGDVIYYSGSDAHLNIDPSTPRLSNSTKAMQRSKLDDRQIRVLRTSAGSSRYAPAVGVRYDGLYRILREQVCHNAKGGAFVRFKLVRVAGQVDIDLSRPTQAEKMAYAVLKESV